MTMTPPTFAAEYRPQGDRGFWRLLVVRPTEGACWDELLSAVALRDCDKRVRMLHRPAVEARRGPGLFPDGPT
jgi:hypothetical protein